MKKGIILGIVIGAIIFGSIGVYATAKVLSKDISYTKKDGTVTNVDDALSELYSRSLGENEFYFIGYKTTKEWDSTALSAGYNYSKYGSKSNSKLTFKESGTYKVKVQMICADGNPKYQFIKNNTQLFQLNASDDRKVTNYSYETIEYEIEVNAGDEVYGRMYGTGDRAFFITYFSKI